MAVLNVRTFAPFMKQRATIERKSGYGDYGETSFSTGVVYQCCVVGKIKKVTNAGGEDAISSQQVILMTNLGFTPEDRITLSTNDVASTEAWALQPEILAVSRYPFLNGQFVTEIALK